MAKYRKLNRETRIRRSILAGLTKGIIINEHVETTNARAKEAQKFVEKMITYGKKGDLVSRRKALAFLHNDNEVTKKIFNDLSIRYKDRNGGYTRIIKLDNRIGDDALIVRIELV
jgi:large subunit ribosomal protein L17